jgi:hypothetical protein
MLLLLMIAVSGCSRALPSSAQYPAPVLSAAQPAVAGRGDTAYARRGAEAIRAALRGLEPDEVLERVPREGLKLPDAEVAAGCIAAPGTLPVLICHYGPAASQPVAQAILWHARAGWQAQLYPQAPARLASERKKALAELGCQIGCYSGLVQARQFPDSDGAELLVVVNLAATGAARADEVQVLHMTNDGWEVQWVPAAGDWNYGHAAVELPAKGVTQFHVLNSSWNREDSLTGYMAEPEGGEHRRFRELWVRKGEGYVLKDRREEPSPFSALVRLIHYLSTGADEKAQALLVKGVDLEMARKALAQKPKRQGWTVVRWGESGFLLDTAGTGKPNRGVRFEQKGENWILAEVWETPAAKGAGEGASGRP